MTEKITSKDIGKMIDHSLLHPTLTDAELKAGCEVARKYGAATCCIKPYHTALAKEFLKGSDVIVCAVIGFPHGNSTTEIKVAETAQVIRDGAVEVDMVINIAKAMQGDWKYVETDIGEVNALCKKNKAVLKVIFETDYLDDAQIVKLCEICTRLSVGFVKTSTGYNYKKDKNGNMIYEGATTHVLELMRKHSAANIQVKAAGACRTLDRFIEVRNMGITRVGTGQTAQIVEEARVRFDGQKAASAAKSADPKGY